VKLYFLLLDLAMEILKLVMTSVVLKDSGSD